MNKFSRVLRQHQRVRHAVYQTEHNIKRSIYKILAALIFFCALHSAALIWFEDLTVWTAVWLTLTTLMTVGYGDVAPTTFYGQLSTIALMYLCGISLVTLLISDYVDYRIARRERIRQGFWDWNMAEHILIVNAPKYNRESYFQRLVSQIRESTHHADTPIMLLNDVFSDGLPPVLRRLGVVHVTGHASDPDDLEKAGASRADHIIVLAHDEYAPISDSLSFDIAHRLDQLQLGYKTILEVVDDRNRPRFKQLNIRSLLRPIRSYPELVVRAMLSPGAELIIEDMFTFANDHTVRIPIWLEGERWADIVSAMVQHNLGTPLAYATKEGVIVTHPDGDHKVHAQSLILLAHTEDIPISNDISEALRQYMSTK